MVGGNIIIKAQISGDPIADSEEQAAVKGVLQSLNGASLDNCAEGEATNGGDFHDKLNAVKKHVEKGQLFNLLPKGFNAES